MACLEDRSRTRRSIRRAVAFEDVAEFREARTSYEAVLADKRAQGAEVAAQAQFMIAETYFHQRDYQSAVLYPV